MQIKKAVPYIVGIAMLFGTGYQQKQIQEMNKNYIELKNQYSAEYQNFRRTRLELNSLKEIVQHNRMLDKETRRAVGILARDGKRTNLEPYPLTEKYSLNNW